jgi:membrane associated rhomboid family serine protease
MKPTLILTILNVVASIYAWEKKEYYYKWMMNPYRIRTGGSDQYYRFITSGFIHGDWVHLIFNMIALYSFGIYLEGWLFEYTGASYQLYYYGIYLTALIISDIPTYLKHKNNPAYNSLGASGAVSAIVFAYVLLNPLGTLTLYFFIDLPAFIFGFIYLIYSYYAGKKMLGGINHDAHLYGAVFGVVVILLIHPSSLPEFFDQIETWDKWKLFN